MAIDYANIGLEPELGAEYLAQYLEDSGIFDTVTFDASTNTVTGFLGTTEVFKVAPNSTRFSFYWLGTAVREVYNLRTFHIGKTSKAVTFTILVSNVVDMYYVIVCKSKGGIPMLIYRNNPEQGAFCVTADYTSTPIQSTYLTPPYNPSSAVYYGYPNDYYSVGVPICTTATGTETVAIADGVEFQLAHKNAVPINLISEITINGNPALAIGAQMFLLD